MKKRDFMDVIMTCDVAMQRWPKELRAACDSARRISEEIAASRKKAGLPESERRRRYG